jgi:hypothetical protein
MSLFYSYFGNVSQPVVLNRATTLAADSKVLSALFVVEFSADGCDVSVTRTKNATSCAMQYRSRNCDIAMYEY